MKSSFRSPLLACVAATLAIHTASATLTGFNPQPAGAAWNRLAPNTGYAIWDSFPALTYTNDAPDAASGITSPLASQPTAFTNTVQGAGLYDVVIAVPSVGTGDVFFPGANTINFALAGSVTFTIRGVVLQVKRAGSSGPLSDQFAPTLSINGGAGIIADQFTLTTGEGDINSDNGLYSVTSWYWGASLAALPNTGTSTFNVNVSRSLAQRSLDGFALDLGSVAVVPEPSVAMLGAFGLALCGLRLRNRRAPSGAVSSAA